MPSPSEELQGRVRHTIAVLGPKRAAERLQMDRATMFGVAAGVEGCRRGTLHQADALALPMPSEAAAQ